MSVLIHVKGIILSNLETDKRIKKAVLDFMNALDNDLVIGGYKQSSEVDEAVENLDKALIEVDTEIENKKLEEEKKEAEEEVDEVEAHGFRELKLDDDEDD